MIAGEPEVYRRRRAPGSVDHVTPGKGNPRDLYGTVLTREDALGHAWLPLFWEVVDLVLEKDPTVRGHFSGAELEQPLPDRPDPDTVRAAP